MVEAIDRLGTISAAAQDLGLTQPALSRQLQEAERRLAVELFRRDRKGMRPTVAGETILQCARRVLGDLAGSERSAVQIPDEPVMPLRLSLGHYDDYRWFADFFAFCSEHFPLANLSIVDSGERELDDALDADEIDLAITAGPVNQRHFATVKLFDDDLVAVASPAHGFGALDHLVAEHFADRVYATWGATYHRGFESERVLLPAGVWPQRVVTISSASAILDFVEAGEAVSVLSGWFVSARAAAGRLATWRITPSGLPVSWQAVVRKSDGPGSPALRAARFLRQWCGGRARPLSVAGDR